MGQMKALAITLDTLTPADWLEARVIMQAGGVDPGTVDLAAVQRDPAHAPIPVLAALIYVARRRAGGRITADRAVHLAQAVTDGE
jgi:hypothetical protein